MTHYLNINPDNPCFTWIFTELEELKHKNTELTLCLFNELNHGLYDFAHTDIQPICTALYNLLYSLASNDNYDTYNQVVKAYLPDKGERQLTGTLYYNGQTFYITHKDSTKRVYTSLDELTPTDIVTAPADYDGALIGYVDERFREEDEDDLIRYFDSFTGFEEND